MKPETKSETDAGKVLESRLFLHLPKSREFLQLLIEKKPRSIEEMRELLRKNCDDKPETPLPPQAEEYEEDMIPAEENPHPADGTETPEAGLDKADVAETAEAKAGKGGEKAAEEEVEKGGKPGFIENMERSLSVVEGYMAGRGCGEAMIDDAMSMLFEMTLSVAEGKLTPEIMDNALNALNHAADVAQSRAEGELSGRNTRIEQLMREYGNEPEAPRVASALNMPGRTTTIFDLAQSAR